MAELEIKKTKSGMTYSCTAKIITLNVFRYFRQQYPEKSVSESIRETAKATGCSVRSIFHFRKQETSIEGFKKPSKTKARRINNINSRNFKYDNNVRQSIKDIIYDLKYNNIVPSLNAISKRINVDSQLPDFSTPTLRRLLSDMGFYYEKIGKKYVLLERDKKSISVKSTNQEIISPSEDSTIIPNLLVRTNSDFKVPKCENTGNKKWIVIDKDQNYDDTKSIWETDVKYQITEVSNQDQEYRSDCKQEYTFIKCENAWQADE